MEQEIRQFRIRLLQFIFAPGLLLIPWLPFGLLFGESILSRVKGPNGEAQIVQSFDNAVSRNYDMLFLGNSRIFRGINPERFAVPTFNFASDNDTFNQMYYKLRWLRKQGVAFNHLAIGVDLFQFSFIADEKNHLYSRYFEDGYLADYKQKPFDAQLRYLRKVTRELNPKYLFMSTAECPHLKQNGQYVRPGVARVTDTVIRSTKRLPVQVDYFERILADCREYGTKVYMCMLPIRPEEQNAYQDGEIEEFMDYIQEFTSDEVALFDFTFDDSYVMADYTDITHLGEAAAERVSARLSQLIVPTIEQYEPRSKLADESPREPTLR